MKSNQNQHHQNAIDIIDHKRIIDIAISKWHIFIISVIIFVLISFFYTKKTVPIYEAEGTLLISEDKSSLSLDIFSTESNLPFGGNTSLQNEIVTLQTYSFALETIKQLDINTSYFTKDLWRLKPVYNNYPLSVEINWDKPQLVNTLFKLIPEETGSFTITIEENPEGKLYERNLEGKDNAFSPLPEGNFTSYKGKFGELISTPFFEFTVYDHNYLENWEEVYFKISDDASLAKYYKNLVSITPYNKETTILQIKIKHPDRKIGELYINTLMNAFLKNDLNGKNEMSQKTLEFIQNQITSTSDSLNQYENELQSYRKINRITSLSEKGSNILQESVKLEDELNRQTLRLEYYKNLKRYLTNPEGQELLVPSVIGIEDPLFNSMVSNLLALQNEKSGLKGVLAGDSFAYTRELNNKIENLKINLNESIANAILNISTHIERLEGMIGVVEKDFNLLPEVERNLIAIERRYKLNESIYTYLLQKKAETEILKASTITKHRILDKAMSNPIPVSPNLSRNLALGVSLGTTLPLLGIIIWLFFNFKLRDPKEIENLLNIPLIALIPRETTRTHILNSKSQSSLTEAFRNIRSTLAIRYNFRDKGTILVTSATPGEGKTFISIKLASIYAALGKKTLLLGMDLRRPKLSSELNIHNNYGITTYLVEEETNWKNLIQSTQQDNLEVLNAGPYLDRSSELIHSIRFEQLIQKIKSEYDFVVIDTSPIGLVSDTVDLTKYSDINLFIFRQNYSLVSQTYLANNLHEKLGIPNLMAIINDVHLFGISGYQYGYNYGRYNKYYSQSPT